MFMKTRDNIYREEASSLVRTLKNYHAITYEQALLLFPKKPDTMKTLIRSLVKQKRIYFDEEKNLLCDRPESADHPDYGLIAAFWVLLDFKKAIVYHINGDFPIKIHFFSQDETYEIIHIPLEQEGLINHVLAVPSKDHTNRIVVLEEESQATLVQIPHVIAFCLVSQDGAVSYYRKGKQHG